jgi:hypothetical protein
MTYKPLNTKVQSLDGWGPIMMRGTGRFRVLALGVVLACTSCQHDELFRQAQLKTSEDAAFVYVAAYPPVPWFEISDKLQPKNNLTIEQARNFAAVTTQVQVSQYLSSFAVGLGIGLATKLDVSKLVRNADGTSTSTGELTRTAGMVPESSGVPSSAITSGVGALDKIPNALGIDGNTLLTAGTALYQQAQILDNQIAKAVYPSGYDAHLLTLQVAIQPTQRNVGADAYVNVTFLPGEFKRAVAASSDVTSSVEGRAPVMVYPLIIMDALETTSVGRTVEAVRQASLALSGTIGAVGANLGLGGGSSDAARVAGLDKNSLVTVGRIADHTIRIRLGAENSGSAGFALVPRTYNVSLVVLTRSDPDEKVHIGNLVAITHTTLHSITDGRRVPSKFDGNRLATAVRDRICFFELGGRHQPEGMIDCKPDRKAVSDVDKGHYLGLLRAASRSDYGLIGARFGIDPEKPIDPNFDKGFSRFLASLIEMQQESRYSDILIPLRPHQAAALPESQQLVLYTDKEGVASFTARGGKRLQANALSAYLELSGDQKLRLLPAKIDVAEDRSAVVASFPSLEKSGLTITSQRPLYIALGSDPPIAYAVKNVTAPPAPDGAKNPVSASSVVLTANADNVATVFLTVGEFPKTGTQPAYLTVSGADVRPDQAIGARQGAGKGIPIAANTLVPLSLGNLSVTRDVTVTTYGTDDQQIGQPIVLPVEPFRGK